MVIVDDEPGMRKLIDEYLTLQGFRVTACDGGRALRTLIGENSIDLIILDLNMPEENGLSIIRDVKATTSIPVILLTASAGAIDRVVGLELGADDYLGKPCELRELLARIRTVLRRAAPPLSGPLKRQLAAIVSLDLVGFGRLLQEDEAGTLAALEAFFTRDIEPSLAKHHGKLFKTMGDGALCEFASVVDAVEWAIDFQRRLALRTSLDLTQQRMQFRVGIAIGDIVHAGTDQFGEGVALAVRVQEIGEPGRVTMSDFTHQLVRARVSEVFQERGVHPLKNIAEPMKIWDWAPKASPILDSRNSGLPRPRLPSSRVHEPVAG